MKQVSEQLVDDHAALDKVLKQLQTALQRRELETAHAKLDLFWARLAVHIRAEHLHLFPAVLSAPVLREAETAVAQLRQDHEFFMHELARAIEIMRKLLTVSEQSIREEGMNDVENRILQIEQRLTRHNDDEENRVYHWATTVLSFEEQVKLAKQISMELQNRPSRFTENTWSGT